MDRTGEYVVQLIVDDGLLSSEPDRVMIVTANSRPTAEAGPDQSALMGETATLDGSGSTDVDGDTLTYRWALIAKPKGTATTSSGSTGAAPAIRTGIP